MTIHPHLPRHSLAVLASCAIHACSGSEPSPNTTAASGGDSTTAATAGNAEPTAASTGDRDTTATDSGDSSPGQTGSADATGDSDSDTGDATVLDQWCEAAAAFETMCAETLSDCDAARLGACVDVFGLEREAFVEARAACGFAEACPSPTGFEQQHCVWQATQDVVPTRTQNELAEAVCAACQPDAKDCLDGFFFVPEPMMDSTGVGGIGSSYLRLDDATVTALLAQCVPGTPASCLPTFYACVNDVVDAGLPAAVARACDVPGPG